MTRPSILGDILAAVFVGLFALAIGVPPAQAEQRRIPASVEARAIRGEPAALDRVMEAILERGARPRDMRRLMPRIRAAAARGGARPALTLARIHASARYGLRDAAAARRWLRIAADRGAKAAQRELAYAAAARGRTGEAMRLLRRASAGRVGDAICRLSRSFARGANGLRADAGAAAYWDARTRADCLAPRGGGGIAVTETSLPGLLRRARRGDGAAAFAVALHYDETRAMPGRLEALPLYLTALAAGEAEAMERVARLLAVADIASEEARSAVARLDRIARTKPDVAVALAELRLAGLGAARDPSAARALLERAAKAGHAGAQFRLGQMHLTGDGAPADPAAAEAHLARAEAGGDARAKPLLAVLRAMRAEPATPPLP